jgi:hypothetical protein
VIAGDDADAGPSTEVWDGILAAVRTDREARADGARSWPGAVVEYLLDPDDVVRPVGDGWAAFADAGEADELVDGPTGTLWDGIGDDDVRDLWRTAVARVRDHRRPVEFDFRCDGPSVRRWYRMTITPRADGALRFRSVLTADMERPDVAALHRDARVPSDRPVVQVCCWCAEASDGDRWHTLEEVLAAAGALDTDVVAPISYGICPRCRASVAAAMLAPPPSVR